MPLTKTIQVKSNAAAVQKLRAEPGQAMVVVIDGVPFTGQKQINGKAVQLVRKGRALEVHLEGYDQAAVVVEDFYAATDASEVAIAVQTLNEQDVHSLMGLGTSQQWASADAAAAPSLPAWGTLVAQAPTTSTAATTTSTAAATSAAAVAAEGPGIGALLFGALGIAAVANSGSSAPAAPAPTSTVTGTVTLGPVIPGHQLTVQLCQADGTTALGSPVAVGADGRFTATVTGYTGVIKAKLIDANDGHDFEDESTGQNKDINAEFWAVGTVASGGTVTLNINPLTTLAFKKLGANPTAAQVDAALAAVETAFGLTEGSLKSTTPIATNSDAWAAAEKTSAAAKLGMALATLSGLDALNGGDMAKTINDLASGVGDNGTLNDAAKNQLLAGAAQADATVAGGLTATIARTVDSGAQAAATAFTASTDVTTLSAATVALLSNTQLGAMTDEQIGHLASAQLAALIGPQIAAMGSDITGLSAAQVAALSNTQLQALTSQQKAALMSAGDLISLSAAQLQLLAIEDTPGIIAAITGTATQGQVLTAGAITDADGGVTSVTYQWKANGVDIAGATGNTLTLAQAQVGKAITVVASYTDHHGSGKGVTSAATGNVVNVNDVPTGAVTITNNTDDTRGTTALQQGDVLAAANTLVDADELGTITYTWKAGDTTVGTGATYTLVQADVGKAITVSASYTDLQGTVETVASIATDNVVNVNDVPTGGVTITNNTDDTRGTTALQQGDVLAAANTLVDADELGTITYTWKAGDTTVGTGATYTLVQADVGKAITVSASYTDLQGTVETVASIATEAVADIDDAGTIAAISGTATQGQVLTAGAITDADGGVDTIVYQWRADGTDIEGAIGKTFTLTQAEVGKFIAVTATYKDAHGPNKNVTSTATSAVADIADAAPVFSSVDTVSFEENLLGPVYTAEATPDVTGAVITYSLSGADAALFDIDSRTGEVIFNAIPDHEAFADADRNNVYNIVITAAEVGSSYTSTREVAISLTDAGDVAPTFTSGTTATFAENTTGTVYTAAATADVADAAITYSLSGADEALFDINASTGVVTFKTAPNHEAPADQGGNNVYDIVVTATEAGNTNTSTRNVAITVSDVTSNITGTAAYAVNLSPGIQGYTANHSTLTVQSAVADPFGQLNTVYELKAGTPNTAQFRAAYLPAANGLDAGTEGATVTLSGYFKKSTHSQISFGTSESYLSVDLDSGSITNRSTSTISASSIQSVGDGWYRVQLTFNENNDANTLVNPVVKLWSSTGGGQWSIDSTSGTMAGTEAVFVYGMQLEKGTGATGLIRTTTAGNVDIDDAAGLGGAGVWTSEEVARGLTLTGLDLTNAIAGDKVELGYVNNGVFTSFATRAFTASLTGNEAVAPVTFSDLAGVQALNAGTQLQLAVRLANAASVGESEYLTVGSQVTYQGLETRDITGTPSYVSNLSPGIQGYTANHSTLTAQSAVADPVGLVNTVYELKAGTPNTAQWRAAYLSAANGLDAGTEGATVTLSGYFKKSTHNLISFGTSESYLSVDLDSGTISNKTTSTISASSIQSVGDGWYRVQLTFNENNDANTLVNPVVKLWSLAGGGGWSIDSTSGTMAGTEAVFVYGMQLEKGTGATGLIRTTTAGNVDIDDAAGLGGVGVWTSEEVARGLTLTGLDLTNAIAGDKVELGYVNNGVFTSFATRAFTASLTGNEAVAPVTFSDLAGVQALNAGTQLQLAVRLANAVGVGENEFLNVGSPVSIGLIRSDFFSSQQNPILNSSEKYNIIIDGNSIYDGDSIYPGTFSFELATSQKVLKSSAKVAEYATGGHNWENLFLGGAEVDSSYVQGMNNILIVSETTNSMAWGSRDVNWWWDVTKNYLQARLLAHPDLKIYLISALPAYNSDMDANWNEGWNTAINDWNLLAQNNWPSLGVADFIDIRQSHAAFGHSGGFEDFIANDSSPSYWSDSYIHPNGIGKSIMADYIAERLNLEVNSIKITLDFPMNPGNSFQLNDISVVGGYVSDLLVDENDPKKYHFLFNPDQISIRSQSDAFIIIDRYSINYIDGTNIIFNDDVKIPVNYSVIA